MEEPLEGTPEDTQDPGLHPAPSTQTQAQNMLHDATRQSEGGTHPASASKSRGPPEGFKLEDRISPARKIKEEKVNIGKDNSGDATTSTTDGGYEFEVNPVVVSRTWPLSPRPSAAQSWRRVMRRRTGQEQRQQRANGCSRSFQEGPR